MDRAIANRDARNRAFYNATAPFYAWNRWRMHENDSAAKSALVDRIGPFAREHVLDVGTGPGIYALEIAMRHADARVVGIDISEKFIAIAKRKAASLGATNIEFKKDNAQNLGFDSDTFDKAICAGVLCLLDEPKAALAELLRVVRPGGLVAIREPLRQPGGSGQALRNVSPRLATTVGMMFGNFSPEYFTKAGLTTLIGSAGFADVELLFEGNDAFAICSK